MLHIYGAGGETGDFLFQSCPLLSVHGREEVALMEVSGGFLVPFRAVVTVPAVSRMHSYLEGE